jgi:hypothetical protein
MPEETTFKDMIEDIYKKPYDQVPKEEIKRQAREVFCFGFSKEDLRFINLNFPNDYNDNDNDDNDCGLYAKNNYDELIFKNLQ